MARYYTAQYSAEEDAIILEESANGKVRGWTDRAARRIEERCGVLRSTGGLISRAKLLRPQGAESREVSLPRYRPSRQPPLYLSFSKEEERIVREEILNRGYKLMETAARRIGEELGKQRHRREIYFLLEELFNRHEKEREREERWRARDGAETAPQRTQEQQGDN